MFAKFIKWLTSQPSSLETYILSKHPTNAAEVDYWTNQYTYAQQKGSWL